MKAAAEFSRSGNTTAVVELVEGTHDGTRDLMPREDDGMPAKRQVRGTETYVRRDDVNRCEVDGLLVWHYDLDRGEVSA